MQVLVQLPTDIDLQNDFIQHLCAPWLGKCQNLHLMARYSCVHIPLVCCQDQIPAMKKTSTNHLDLAAKIINNQNNQFWSD